MTSVPLSILDLAAIGDGETRVCRRIAEYLDEVGISSELAQQRGVRRV